MNWPMVGSWLRLVVCFWYHQKHLEAAPEEAQYSVHNGSALDYGENGCVSIIVKNMEIISTYMSKWHGCFHISF